MQCEDVNGFCSKTSFSFDELLMFTFLFVCFLFDTKGQTSLKLILFSSFKPV